ncbi:hypothetical protein F503_03208 [Ophiostoma piceae UAMH 11346]|uniref:Uncharacterized protein n=1 Tax=Ophiostoma piceae (strain UAMH 11346) TaxID=1262450 RepID=S3C4M6_OPHP1|nr:hypothetical protein F503_03208 [Ophiostoma piceae UAMH 11346]
MTQEVSHGRGGAGNIIKDDTPYVDGEIVRAGPEGSHDDGPYSTGRGGAGNHGDKGDRRSIERADREVIPEAAVRPSGDHGDYHTGRGGAGNSHISPEAEAKQAEKPGKGAAEPMVGLADKLKQKLTGVFKK